MSRRYLQVLSALIVAGISLLLSISDSLAQPSAAFDGRLGGTLSSIEERFGIPDATTNEYLRYNSIMTSAGTATLVFYSNQSQVGSIAIVFPAQPSTLVQAGDFTRLVMEYTPSDSACLIVDPLSVPDTLTCQSEALAGVYTESVMGSLGLSGVPGDIGILVNPIPDTYYEVVIQPGLQPGMASFPASTQGDIFTSASAEDAETRAEVVGRVGGTRAQFEAGSGAPYETVIGDDVTTYWYAGPAGSKVSVAYSSVTGEERVFTVGVFTTGITTSEAAEIVFAGAVSNYAPNDIQCANPDSSDGGMMITIYCASPALQDTVGTEKVEIKVIVTGTDLIVFISYTPTR